MAGRRVIYGRPAGQAGLLSTLEDILKLDYILNNILDTVNMRTWFLSQIRKKRQTGGLNFQFPVRYGVSEGQGNAPENADLPEPGFGLYETPKGNVKFQYASFYITGPAMAATNKAAYVDSMKEAIKNTRDGFTLETYQQTWGGADAVIAKAKTKTTITSGALTLPIKDPYGLDYDAAQDRTTLMPIFRIGMRLSLYRGDTYIGTATIGGITAGGDLKLTGTWESGITFVDVGDTLHRGTSGTMNNRNRNYLGLTDIMKAEGTYLGIDRADKPFWQANLVDRGSDPFNDDLVQATFDLSEIAGDGMASPNLLLSNHRLRRQYVKTLVDQKRFASPQTTKLEGGYTYLDFNGQPWMVDKLCPPERLLYLHMPDFCWVMMHEIGWLNEDHGNMLQRVSRKDAYEAFLKTYREIVCEKPANQAMLYGVGTDATSA